MSDYNRNLFRFISEVLARHETPLLAALAGGRWQIVGPDGSPLSEECASPYKAWKSAAERVGVKA